MSVCVKALSKCAESVCMKRRAMEVKEGEMKREEEEG